MSESGTIQPASQWTTGEDPVTTKQAAFLSKLADEHGVSVDTDHMNKAEASQKIDELKTSGGGGSGGVSTTDKEEGSQNPAITHPSEWTTGGETATQKQKAYIAVLEKRAGEGVHGLADLSKSEASERIEELREKTGE